MEGEDHAVKAVLDISEAQHGDTKMGEEEKLDEKVAVQVGERIAESVEGPARPVHALQDGLNFENARRDEAVAQGVEVTTQERLYELARQEEAQANGLEHYSHTTTELLFRQSRGDEAVAEKWEESQHGPVEPVTISTDGVDQVAADKELAKETPQLRQQATAKTREERGETPAKKRPKSRRSTTSKTKAGTEVAP